MGMLTPHSYRRGLDDPSIREIAGYRAWVLPHFMPFGQEPEIVHIRGGDLRIHQYVKRVKAQRHATEAAVVQELVEAGYAETVR
jgi:hypothetical protein